MKAFTLRSNKIKQQEFYIQVTQDILSSNPGALELLKSLVVLNSQLETNISKTCIESSYKSKDFKISFDDLVNKWIIIEKESKEGLYEFSSPHLQDAISTLADENNHKHAIRYYTIKIDKYGENLNDQIEILYHNVKIEPSEGLVNEFLSITQSIEETDYRFKRLIKIKSSCCNKQRIYLSL